MQSRVARSAHGVHASRPTPLAAASGAPYRQVFEGTWTTPSGEERVVLKRVKAKVQGASEMQEMELALNEYAAKVARGHCADFLGYSTVTDEDRSRGSTLTTGLWLTWKYEGSRTLDYYLRRRDTHRALANDLEVPLDAVVPTVMKQVFSSLEAFHAAGLIHRDIKPSNVIFAEEQRRFKLIDLGACADLRTGKNYVPDESILDPQYAPPEKCLLRERSIETCDEGHVTFNDNAPRMSASEALRSPFVARGAAEPGCAPLEVASGSAKRRSGSRTTRGALSADDDELAEKEDAPQATAFGAAVGMWRQLTGKMFDLEAKISSQRNATRTMTTKVKKLRKEAVKGVVSPAKVAEEERRLQKMEERVQFLEQDLSTTAKAATGLMGFFKQLSGGTGTSTRTPPAEAGASASSSGRSGSRGTGSTTPSVPSGGKTAEMWRKLAGRISQVEGKLDNQESAIMRQSFTVKKLRQKVTGGVADPATLDRAEVVLSKMERRLGQLEAERLQTQQAVEQAALTGTGGGTGLWNSLFGNGSGKTAAAAAARVKADAAARVAAARAAPRRELVVYEDEEEAIAAVLAPPSQQPARAAPSTSSGGGLLGFAMRAALGVATSLKAESDRVLRNMEEAEEARRLAKANDAMFGSLLREADPPITPRSTLEQLEPIIGSDPRWGRLQPDRRQLQLALYIETLISAEETARARATTQFKALLRRQQLDVESSSWLDVQTRLEREPAFKAVGSSDEQYALFEEVMAELREARNHEARASRLAADAEGRERSERAKLAVAQRRQVEAAEKATRAQAEVGFMQLLASLEPPLTASTQWSSIAAQVAQHPTAVAAGGAGRAVELFTVFVSQLAARERALGEAAAHERAHEAKVDAAERAEQVLLALLAKEVTTPECVWSKVRAKLQDEAAFVAVPVTRRKELYDVVLKGVIDTALASDSSVDLPGAAPTGSAPAAATGAKGGPLDLGRIETLRREQARLRQEYEDMERKLRTMERSMREREMGAPLVPNAPQRAAPRPAPDAQQLREMERSMRERETRAAEDKKGGGTGAGPDSAPAKEGGREVMFQFLQRPLDGGADFAEQVKSHSSTNGKQ
ncbi:hypothetical protein FOA52_010940 [Chlamydomonas sp. UWO 241]|nr:hypothetical protein FOA52_010940 [Chlamydomonas sp. UWO 241]